ncbi:MAG: hypothetical protein ACRD2D_08880, partial [Terriglobales bacterium]
MNLLRTAASLLLVAPFLAQAQHAEPADAMSGAQMVQSQTKQSSSSPSPGVEDMSGMQMCPTPTLLKEDRVRMELMDNMRPRTFLQEIEHHASSGTSAEPDSTPAPMLMTMRGPWMLMFHSEAFIIDTQETSPRGKDKFYSTNWFMPMAERRFGPAQLTLRAMFSLEPATITGRQYPLLFQQGETAFGKPIADGQH